MEKELLLVVEYKMLPGRRDAFLQAAADLCAYFNTEPGCICYRYLTDPADPDALVLVERWQKAQDQQAHMQTEQFAALRAMKDDYIAASSMRSYTEN